MRATGPDRRSVLFLLASGGRLRAATEERVTDVLARLATAIGDRMPSDFLMPIDPAMPDYAELERNVRALLAFSDVGSSVTIVEDAGDDRRRTVRADWILQNRGVRRRDIVTFEFVRNGKHWRIASLKPVAFFAAFE